MPDIFLSYSREDQVTARRFAEALGREGFSVWWDQTLAAGEAYDEVTEQALREARAVVVLWSKTSVVSRWVRAEATIADRNGTLVPAMIEDCTRPVMFELRQSADLSRWQGDVRDPAWQTFVADTRRVIGRQGAVAASAGVAPTSTAVNPTLAVPQLPARRRKWMVPVLAAAALLAITGAAWHFQRGAAGPQSLAREATASAPVTLAVLPLVNDSGDPGQETLSDGLTDEIITALAQVPGLDVTGRTSSFSFKGANKDPRSIASELGVDNLLEGSVRRDGDGKTLRINVRLLDGRGSQRWGKSYSPMLKDVLTLQTLAEVAADVAKALRVTLDVGVIRREEGGTTNPDAWESLVEFTQLALQDNPETRLRRQQLLRDAVDKDREFALAWFRLAGVLGEGAEQQNARRKVLELAPDSWMARSLRFGKALGTRPLDWTELEALARSVYSPGEPINAIKADQVAPYYVFMMQVGRVKELAQVAQRQYELDPRVLGFGTRVQQTLEMIGRPDLADQQYQRNLALPGNHAEVHLYKLMSLLRAPERDPAAIDAQFIAYLKDRNPDPEDPMAKLARIHRDRGAVLAFLEGLYAQPDGKAPLSMIAEVADAYGAQDLALRALRRHVIDQGAAPGFLWWYPYSSQLRADPRFKAMLRELGLADYFRKSGNWGDFCKPVGETDFECH